MRPKTMLCLDRRPQYRKPNFLSRLFLPVRIRSIVRMSRDAVGYDLKAVTGIARVAAYVASGSPCATNMCDGKNAVLPLGRRDVAGFTIYATSIGRVGGKAGRLRTDAEISDRESAGKRLSRMDAGLSSFGRAICIFLLLDVFCNDRACGCGHSFETR